MFLNREITMSELAIWSMNLFKLDDIKEHCLDIAQQVANDEEYEKFEDLFNQYPAEFSDDKLVEFLKPVKGIPIV